MSEVRKYRLEMLDPFGVPLFGLELWTEVLDGGADVFTGFLSRGSDEIADHRRAALGNDRAAYSLSVSRMWTDKPK